jgi:hypothetical protein
VREFQFVQDTLQDYRLLLVAPRRDEAEALQSAWREKIMAALGPAARLTVEYVEAIPTLPSGKRKFTLSHVQE